MNMRLQYSFKESADKIIKLNQRIDDRFNMNDDYYKRMAEKDLEIDKCQEALDKKDKYIETFVR